MAGQDEVTPEQSGVEVISRDASLLPRTGSSLVPRTSSHLRLSRDSCNSGSGMRMYQEGISAVLQERMQKVSVLEVRRERPAEVIARDMSRKHLLDEANSNLKPVPVSSSPAPPPLVARDVRKVDPTFRGHGLEPAFMIRNGAILASLAPCGLHAIILFDRLYLLLPPHHKQSSSVSDVRARSRKMGANTRFIPCQPGRTYVTRT